jgi:hypothetical protein
VRNLSLPDGALVLAGHGQYRLGQVVRSGKLAGAEGHWILDSTGDPGSTAGQATFSPGWCTTPAVLGETVCATPLPDCGCGLAHLGSVELSWLRGRS